MTECCRQVKFLLVQICLMVPGVHVSVNLFVLYKVYIHVDIGHLYPLAASFIVPGPFPSNGS